ncbi:MAG TPA: hypothetical protein DCE41_09880 [Cytophagales bacterium]|nr:hypothetical protein [Cytophagales bacterium]HAA22207.1 hypothetical protein [Cytophagales bacterium]HAP63008.1 hypothetical protein [Cytophagales bacterium]
MNRISKTSVLSSLKDLPEQFSTDELMDKLILIQKVEEGLKQSENGETYTTDEIKAMLKKWSK